MTRIDRFTCEETFRRLDDYLDRELGADETALIEQHLQTCETCARLYTFEAGVLWVIRSKLQRLKAPAGLQSTISRLIREQQDGPPSGASP